MKFRFFLPVIFATLLLGGVAFAAYGVGDHVSNFTLPDASGDNHTLYDYEGAVIVLNFWESW